MIQRIRVWLLERRLNKPRYSTRQYENMRQRDQDLLMSETRQQFAAMRMQLVEKESVINELKTKQSLTQKPKRVVRRKPSRKGRRV
jgi:hypothetical protein